MMGGERPLENELKEIGKPNLKGNELLQASHMLKEKYPAVFRQATFLTGIRSETAKSIEVLGKYTRDANLDFVGFHTVTPYPGTPFWEKANKEGWIEDFDFTKYDMFYPVMSSETLSRAEIAKLSQKLSLDFVRKRPLKFISGLFSIHAIRRKLHWWFVISITRVMVQGLVNSLLGKQEFKGFATVNTLWKPEWYEK
jgi:anaerobic magnesium-protoporphyrin IX monomethyl ester cyclase